MNRQDAWSEQDKKAFLKYLNSNAPVPTGQVKEYSAPRSASAYSMHKARYMTLSLATDTMMPVDPTGKATTEKTTLGGKFQTGGHLFSWVRYYVGAQFNPLKQKRLDGKEGSLSHLQVPVGLEFALIPLGTPQTRYVLLRGGAAVNSVTGSDKKADFAAPLLGTSYSWNIGLGYEWQVPDSRWRLNLVAEAYKSMKKTRDVSYTGLGLTAGVAYTF